MHRVREHNTEACYADMTPGHTCACCRWAGEHRDYRRWCSVRCRPPRRLWATVACPLWTPEHDDVAEMRARATRGGCVLSLAPARCGDTDGCGTMHLLLRDAMARVGVPADDGGQA